MENYRQISMLFMNVPTHAVSSLRGSEFSMNSVEYTDATCLRVWRVQPVFSNIPNARKKRGLGDKCALKPARKKVPSSMAVWLCGLAD